MTTIKGSPFGRAPAIAGERVFLSAFTLSVGYAATSPIGRGYEGNGKLKMES
jgi:hypothetical protein